MVNDVTRRGKARIAWISGSRDWGMHHHGASVRPGDTKTRRKQAAKVEKSRHLVCGGRAKLEVRSYSSFGRNGYTVILAPAVLAL